MKYTIKKIKKTKKYKGYSFLEGIFAAFIVSVGMVSIVGLMASNLLVFANNRNQTIASFLTQEGVEIVKNIRDNNWANERATFYSNFPASSSGDCRADYSSSTLACSSTSSKDLYKSSDGFYSHTVSNSTGFKRKIVIIYDTGSRSTANEATVTSVVTWGNANLPSGSTINANNCNHSNKCLFASVVLNKWGSKID